MTWLRIVPFFAVLLVCSGHEHSHSAALDHVDLVTFDGAQATTFKWKAQNDPVMGGQSHSVYTLDEENKKGKWVGEVKIVPSLKAPGFCKIQTGCHFEIFGDTWKHLEKFSDASPYSHLQIQVRSNISYTGWKIAFAADTWNPIFNSFKAPFNVLADGAWHLVSIPFSDFSNDWSSYTGDCFTKDPDGKQHVCCTESTPEKCPTMKNLKDISQLSIWAEGGAGKFDLEIGEIGAGFGEICSSSEYCCPDAKVCLAPSKISCAADAHICDGTSSPVCCPLTKLCVTPGNPCTTPCEDKGAYCCPDAKRCLTPINPGKLCSVASDCSSSEVCCPLTKLCVSVADACVPGAKPTAPWWPRRGSIVV